MDRKTSLQVNGVSINMDRFVESFVYHTTIGMIDSLQGTDASGSVHLAILEDGKVALTLKGKPVKTTSFVDTIVTSTAFGMVQPLKGVSSPVKLVTIEIQL